MIKSKISFSLLNQILISLLNLGVNLLLVKNISPVDFGVYGALFSVAMLFLGFGTALFVNTYITSDSTKENSCRDPTKNTLGIVFLYIPLIFLALMSDAVNFGLINYYSIPISVGIFFCVAYSIKDYASKINFFHGNHAKSIKINATILVTTLGLMFGFKDNLNYLLVCVISSTSILITLVLLEKKSIAEHFKKIRNVREIYVYVKEKISYTRWASFGVLVIWIQSQCYVYLQSILGNFDKVAEANAARLYVAPVIMMMPAISQVSIPKISKNIIHDPASAAKTIKKFIALEVLSLTIYAVMLYIFWDKAYSYIKDSYGENIKKIVVIWFVYVLILMVRDGLSSFLIAKNEYKYITSVNIFSSAVCVGAFFLLSNMSEAGVLSLLVGEFILATTMLLKVQKIVKG